MGSEEGAKVLGLWMWKDIFGLGEENSELGICLRRNLRCLILNGGMVSFWEYIPGWRMPLLERGLGIFTQPLTKEKKKSSFSCETIFLVVIKSPPYIPFSAAWRNAMLPRVKRLLLVCYKKSFLKWCCKIKKSLGWFKFCAIAFPCSIFSLLGKWEIVHCFAAAWTWIFFF